MFLKRFEAKGFKSFAENTVINFTHGMTGVVGPNGSGKSNIVDGLKWVLGEKSKKELRGKESSDFIFSGSETYEPASYAEVSLTFDNSKKYLKTDLEEITVTRKLTRGIGKNEYFINGEPCLLNDIKEIFVDTGLQRGSLGVISQGTVSWFTEAKAIERRKIFEDASGIGKYTLAKNETEKKLISTRMNLSIAQDKFEKIEKDIKRLSKQAEQAQIYLAKKEQLKNLEINVFVKDAIEWQNKLANIAEEITEKSQTKTTDSHEIQQIEHSLEIEKKKFHEIDQTLNDDQNILNEINQEYQDLKNKRATFELNLKNQLSSDKLEQKVAAIQSLLSINETELIETQTTAETLKEEIITLEEINDQVDKKIEQYKREISIKTSDYQKKKHEYDTTIALLDNSRRYSYGLKAILDNKNSLRGIYDVLENLIEIEPEHELAIVTALGKSLKNIVVKTSDDAKNAVNFLKNNRAGQATFLPLRDLRYTDFPDDLYDLLSNTNGFVGMANDLVQCDDLYRPAVDALLNKVIISDDFDNAFKHAKLTNHRYRIYTLDGDYLATSGVITGGYNRQIQKTGINLEKKKQDLLNEIETIAQKVRQDENECNQLINVSRDNKVIIEPKKFQLIQLNTKIESLIQEIKNNKNELEQYDYSKSNPDHQQEELNRLASELVHIKKRLDDQKNQVDSAVNLKEKYRLSIQENEQKLKIISSNHNQKTEELNKLTVTQTRLSTLLENTINNLSQKYEMTLDYAIENFSNDLDMSLADARNLIKELNDELNKFSSVNLKAAEELKELEVEHSEKKELYEKVAKACADLEAAIKELDAKAIASFSHIIDESNRKLPEIFQYLFGGGTCEITYEDPDNILTSGIEIKTYLPGKTITNLMLFSGGEKTLIALSVLFAVLQTSIMPLVILDEAESALDPANVERFGNIILKNSEKTQFITITHRPGTMERCDILYGVTMAKKGVSTIIPVKLKDATKYVQESK